MNDRIERNWLIRTNQKQILGPIPKQKVIEFIQKGSLGPADEICSGNGYWFYVREQDLIEKYLLGDVPQGYNPISEARTVVARKSNSDNTASINSSPAHVTQIINLKELDLNKIPKADDLEFPDVDLVVKNVSLSQNEVNKIPAVNDLEFPDHLKTENKIASPVSGSVFVSSKKSGMTKKEAAVSHEEIQLPMACDLEFPDEEIKFEIASEAKKIDENKTETMMQTKMMGQASVIDQLEIDETIPPLTIENKRPSQENLNQIEKKIVDEIKEIKRSPIKLLSDRKTKSQTLKDEIKKANEKQNPSERVLAPELKNRNDSYLLILLVILVVIVFAVIFYYYRFILNKPLPV